MRKDRAKMPVRIVPLTGRKAGRSRAGGTAGRPALVASSLGDNFPDILARFVERETRFLVVGAHALAVYGVTRDTGDLDLWVEPTPSNAKRVWSAFVEFGVPLAALGIQESDFAAAGNVIQFGSPPHRIDILTGISGVSFADAWRGRVEHKLFGVAVPFPGLEALIANKRATGRQRDLGDVAALQQCGGSG